MSRILINISIFCINSLLKFIEEIPTDEWEVDTPTGYQSFSGIGKTKEYTKWIIKTANRELICADYHIVIILILISSKKIIKIVKHKENRLK